MHQSTRTLQLLLLVAMSLLTQMSSAQGIRRGFDHSIAVKDLVEERGPKGLAAPRSLPLPPYPGELLRYAINGEVTVRFLVHENGSVGNASIVAQSQEEFSKPSLEAVAQWKFQPVTDGKTQALVPVWMRCRIVFKMEVD